jgi:hypothetical protein
MNETTSVAGKGKGETKRFPQSFSFADAAIAAARRRRRDSKKGGLGGNMVSPKGASAASDATEVAVAPELAK